MNRYDEDDQYWSKKRGYTDRHSLKLSLPPDVHLPNKNEAKLLRRLKAETGLSEEEIRSIHKYRKMLSEESKKEGKKNETQRRLISLMKSITKELKLPKEHPNVLDRFWNRIKEIREKGYWFTGYWDIRIGRLSNDQIMNTLKLKRKP
jgi:hypothetical protein